MRTEESDARSGKAVGSTVLGDKYEIVADFGPNPYLHALSALEVATGAPVRIYWPTADLLERTGYAYRFERAALEAVELRHSHLIGVLGVGREDGVPCMVTEASSGDTLEVLIADGRTETGPGAVLPWLRPIAEAIDFLHGHTVVHGEVHPTTLLRDARGRWRLGDLSASAARAGLEKAQQHELVTKRQGFTAPEVIGGEPPTASSDQYALAACVYYALTGERPPTTAEAAAAKLRQVVSIDAAVYILRALSPAPGKRHQSCTALAEAFLRNPVPTPEPEETQPEEPRRRVPARVLDDEPRARDEDDAPESAEEPPPPAEDLPRCWRVRLGRHDEYASAAHSGHFIALGFAELGDLRDLAESSDAELLEALIQRFERIYGAGGPAAVMGAGQLWRFVRDMKEGDLVLVPDPDEGLAYLGRIDGPAFFSDTRGDGCAYPRRRRVEWIGEAKLAGIPHALLRRLAGSMPVIDLAADTHHVLALQEEIVGSGKALAEEERLLACVVDAIESKSPEALMEFLRGLFAALRYDAELLPQGEDGIWEARGFLAGRGLSEVSLRTTVYRTDEPLDVDVIYATRGSLEGDEHATLISMAGFTRPARAEAGEAGKKPIRLLDSRTLAAMAIENWNDLPPRVRDALGIERIERTSVEVLFRPKP